MKKNREELTTECIKGVNYYDLPFKQIMKTFQLEIFNEKKKEWRKEDFIMQIKPIGRKLITDKIIRISYDTN